MAGQLAPMTRYETIAKLMAEEIRSGSIGIGSRMPSLRQIMSQQRVSQATASRAYHLLEKWGTRARRGTLRVLCRTRRRVRRDAAAPARPARRHFASARHQRARIFRARCDKASGHRSARVRVCVTYAFSASKTRQVPCARHPPDRPVAHGHRSASRQRTPADADRASLHWHWNRATYRRNHRDRRRT